MSSSDRRSFLALAVVAAVAGGCGFTPAYAPGGPAEGLLGRVWVDAPADRNSFDLVERLEERLGRPHLPAFRLGYRITVESEGAAITPEGAITRYTLKGSTSFTLFDKESGAVLTTGRIIATTAYSASGTVVSTSASERDATAKLMRLMADQIVTRLIATSGKWGGA